jgi:hypothetical protein
MTERERYRKIKNDKKLKLYFHNYINSIVALERIEDRQGTKNPPSLKEVLNTTDRVNKSINILVGTLKHKYKLNEQQAKDLIIAVCNGITKK